MLNRHAQLNNKHMNINHTTLSTHHSKHKIIKDQIRPLTSVVGISIIDISPSNNHKSQEIKVIVNNIDHKYKPVPNAQKYQRSNLAYHIQLASSITKLLVRYRAQY